MAITAANRDSGSNNTPEVSTTTNSVAFANSKLYLLAVALRGGTTPAVTVTGGGLTWVLEDSYQVGSPPAIFVFRGLVASGASTGALTLTSSGTPTSAKWSIDEFDGIDTSGTDGSGAIVQSVGNGGSATSGSITLASFGDATNNAAYGAFMHSATEATNVDTTPGAYTELSDNATAVSPILSMGTEWRIGEDTAVAASWTSSVSWTGLAIELKAAPTYTITQGHFRVRSDDTQGLNTDAGWAGALDSNVIIDAEKEFRIRFEVETPDSPGALTFKLQYRRNGGAYTDVVKPAGTPPAYTGTYQVEIHDSAQFADNAATTNLLSGSGRTFKAGAGITADNLSPSITLTNEHTEYEFPLLIRLSYGAGPMTTAGRNVDGDTFEFRMVEGAGAAFGGTNVNPTITLNVPKGLIGGTISETPHRIGPFKDANGNLYYVCEYAEPANWFLALKSTDGGDSWAEMDRANNPTTKDLECLDIQQVGDTLWILLLGMSKDCTLHTFRMSNHASPDTWGIRDESVYVSTVEPADQSCSIAVRSDGTVVAFYNRDPSGTAEQIGYKIRSAGGTWGSEVILDTQVGTSDFTDSVAVVGADDKVHVFYQDLTNGLVWHRSLSSADVLSAREQVDSGLATGNTREHVLVPAIYYDNAGAETIIVGYTKSDDTFWTNSVVNDGTPGTPQQVTTAIAVNIGGSDHPAAFIRNDGKDVYAFWADAATQDLWRDVNVSLAGWGTDIQHLPPTQVDLITGMVYTHSAGNGGQKVLGMVVDIASSGFTGKQQYIESVLGGSGQLFDDFAFPMPEWDPAREVYAEAVAAAMSVVSWIW